MQFFSRKSVRTGGWKICYKQINPGVSAVLIYVGKQKSKKIWDRAREQKKNGFAIVTMVIASYAHNYRMVMAL